MKLANGGSSTVLGCEFVLFDFFGSSKQVGIALKGLNIEENTLTKIKISDESVHNFTVLVNSAFAEFYYMDMNKFKELCEKYVH